MPKALWGHEMVTYGTDLVVLGGNNPRDGDNSSCLYQFSSENGIIKWEEMKLKMKIPRSNFVAMAIPDHLVDDA